MMNLAHQPVFRLGGMKIRPATREITFAVGREVLEPRVMSVLVRLAQAKGEVITREELTEACWEGRVVSDDAINRVISRIRRVSELTGGKDFTLETITKVGYRLVAAEGAEAIPEPPSTASAQPAASAKRRMLVPVALIAALAITVATGAWWLAGRKPEWKADPNASLTVAVLPFDNLGRGDDDDMLAVGMSREIRNTLSRVRGLKVVSDSSSFAVAAQNLSATDIREKLWADLLVDGSMSRTADTVKLTAELVDAYSGNNLWTGAREGPSSDLNRLQQLMSAAIFEQIVARVGPSRLQQLAPPKPSDPRVYRMTIEATELLSQAHTFRRHGQVEAALDAGGRAYTIIQGALAIEPDSAAALAVMGSIIESSSAREFVNSGMSAEEKFDLAADYRQRALAADPDNTVALFKVAEYYRRNEWRWAESRSLFERALALNPNDATTHTFYSFYLSGVGRCVEGLEHARIAEALDPIGLVDDLAVPRTLDCMGRQEEADKIYDKVFSHDPSDLFILSEMYLRLLARHDSNGLKTLASRVRDDVWRGEAPPKVQAMLDRMKIATDALEGRPEAFLAFLNREAAAFEKEPSLTGLSAEGRRNSDVRWMYAVEFAFAGDTSRAIEMLRGGIAGGSPYIPSTMPYGANEFTPEMRADPRYQAIWRSDPRLVELMKLRLEALEAGQMEGVFPDGRRRVVDSRS